MQAITQLQSMGYDIELTPGERIRLSWKKEDKVPDPAVVSPLLEDLKAHRDQAVDHLRRVVAVDVLTPGGRKTISIHGSDGRPTEAAVDLADRILSFLADQADPATEFEILTAMGGDQLFTRNVLHRLTVEGLAELAGHGRYTIPSHPPAPANLPPDCPLQGGPVPSGCRFEARLLARLIQEGALPLPGGRCPLRGVCKVAAE